MTDWSPQQDKALKAVSDWLKVGRPQVFYLGGYAGTGKTTLARHFAEGINGQVLFGAFTGKAALVMRSKGCWDASTIHSMIYVLEDEADGAPQFVLNQASPIKNSALAIIDECSMVNEELGSDLLSFRTPVLVLGDPAQLPPVKGGGYFTNREPDIMLTEVHRQARDNPIIAMATTVREGGTLALGEYGESLVIDRGDTRLNAETVLASDQLLVGRNTTRRSYNRRVRDLQGKKSIYPIKGDRLVCLRNHRPKGLLNGGIWAVDRVKKGKGMDSASVHMIIRPTDTGGGQKNAEVSVRREFFEGREDSIPWDERRYSDEFDYGYALTVHKAQGSQWDDVMLFDESPAFRESARRWLYTGITRAAKRVVVVK